MPKKGGEKHEIVLESKLKKLNEEGWKTINLHGKSPDGIAVKNNKIYAVEILQKIRVERKNPIIIKRKGRWKSKYAGGYTLASKKSNYDMFDDVIFDFYK